MKKQIKTNNKRFNLNFKTIVAMKMNKFNKTRIKIKTKISKTSKITRSKGKIISKKKKRSQNWKIQTKKSF